MNMKKALIVVLAMVLTLGLVACGENTGKNEVAIRGEITNVSQGQDNIVTFIFVEGSLESDTEYDKASITITNKTKVINKDNKKKISRADLKVGMQVEVVFEGPVRESYPVQADAKEVRVLDK
jgi:beta-N-acetylhexosaminidase